MTSTDHTTDRRAASMAHMTDADIQYWIGRLTAERSVPLYALKVSSYEYDRSGEDLFNYEQELKCRQAAASARRAA